MDFDDYEMKEREQEQEREQERAREELEEANQEEQAEQETNFDDIEDVIVDIGDLEDGLGQQQVDMDLDGGIPNVGKDVASIKRSITNDVKKIFKDVFDVSIQKKNGKNSKDILENTKFVSSKGV